MLVLALIHRLARKPEKAIATEIIKCKGRRHECTKTFMLLFCVWYYSTTEITSHTFRFA